MQLQSAMPLTQIKEAKSPASQQPAASIKEGAATTKSETAGKHSKNADTPAEKTESKDFASLLQQTQVAEKTGTGKKLSLKDLPIQLQKLLNGQGVQAQEDNLSSQIRELLQKLSGLQTETGSKPGNKLDTDLLKKLEKLLSGLSGDEKFSAKELIQLSQALQELLTGTGDLSLSAQKTAALNLTEPELCTTMKEEGGKDKQKNDSGTEPKIVVIDLRTSKSTATTKNHPQVTDKTGKADPEAEAGKDSQLSRDIRYFSSQTGGSEVRKESSSAAFADTFRNVSQGLHGADLTKLKETLKGEVVKNTGILLKNNNNGEIRLILKPEALGRVRINVNLNNNHIDGRIMVENNTVREIFETSLESLNASLKAQGFDSVALEVAVGDRNSGRRQQQQEADLIREEVTKEFDKQIPLLGEYGNLDALINLVV